MTLAGFQYYAVTDEEFTLGKDTAEAWQEMIVPWSDVVSYAYTTIGGAVTAYGLIQFSPGAVHPYLPLFSTSVNVKKLDYDPNGLGWKNALVRSTFGPQKYDQNNNQHIDIKYDAGAEQTPIPAANFTALDGDGNPVALPSDTKDFPRVTVVSKLTIEYPFMPNFQPSVWAGYIGNVNSVQFPNYPGISGWGPGQVLFVGLHVNRSTSVQTGGVIWDYGFEFWIREDPSAQWNSLLNDQTGVWTPIYYTQNTSKQPYPTTDLNPLLNLPGTDDEGDE